mmetsp:Transcript_62385/g.197009  ORF Transcript_62385/g.197009 Transcript_62385/m.197009 type:complete len:317 (+) Transcript_62385:429-1379(+)
MLANSALERLWVLEATVPPGLWAVSPRYDDRLLRLTLSGKRCGKRPKSPRPRCVAIVRQMSEISSSVWTLFMTLHVPQAVPTLPMAYGPIARTSDGTARSRVMPLGRPVCGSAAAPHSSHGFRISAKASESVRRHSTWLSTACRLYCFNRAEKRQPVAAFREPALLTDMCSTTRERRQRRHTVGSGAADASAGGSPAEAASPELPPPASASTGPPATGAGRDSSSPSSIWRLLWLSRRHCGQRTSTSIRPPSPTFSSACRSFLALQGGGVNASCSAGASCSLAGRRPLVCCCCREGAPAFVGGGVFATAGFGSAGG